MDKPEENDSTFDNNGYTFIINNELLEQVKSVTIAFSYMGFSVEPGVPLGGGGGCGGGCGSSCPTGTC